MHTIIITLRDGSTETMQASFDWEAKAICKEEVKWENTLRVVCETIGFDQEGSFV